MILPRPRTLGIGLVLRSTLLANPALAQARAKPTGGWGFFATGGDALNQSGLKKRPAVVVSSAAYHTQRRDLVIMAITSQIRPHPAFAEFTLAEWKKAGLLAPSAVKPVLTTIEKRLVLKKLGQLPRSPRC